MTPRELATKAARSCFNAIGLTRIGEAAVVDIIEHCINEAVAVEREACALTCRDTGDVCDCAERIEARIRARGR